MFWLIAFVFAALIACAWLENEDRQIDYHINKLADASRKAADDYKYSNDLWVTTRNNQSVSSIIISQMGYFHH